MKSNGKETELWLVKFRWGLGPRVCDIDDCGRATNVSELHRLNEMEPELW